MKRSFKAIGGVSLLIVMSALAGSVFAVENAPATAPSTQPIAITMSAQGGVLVTPFTPIGNASALAWAAKAVQQSLVADLARVDGPRPLAIADAVPDINSALTLGKQTGARFVIFGSYQQTDVELRFTGQLLDVETGKIVGGLSATGAHRDLFAMEDTLAAQAKQQLKKFGNTLVVQQQGAAPAATVVVRVETPVAATGSSNGTPFDGSDLQKATKSDNTASGMYADRYASQRNRYLYYWDYASDVYGAYWPYRSIGPGYGWYPSFNYGFGYSNVTYGPSYYSTGSWTHGHSHNRSK